MRSRHIELFVVQLYDFDELREIEFRWWRGRRLEMAYRYAREQGLASVWNVHDEHNHAVRTQPEVESQ